jgi:uncharacterized protein
MPTRDGYQQGIPSFVTLSTTDLARAKEFYAALFDWEYRDEDTGSGPYVTALRRGLPAAGIELETGDPGWITYFAVTDADEASNRIVGSGGTVTDGPRDVVDTARVASALDPAGARFRIWQAGRQFGAVVVNEHGALNWNELITDDIDAVSPFYEAVFGHELHRDESYTMFKVGNREVAGGGNKPEPDVPNHWNVYFAVDDADRAVESTRGHGGTVIREARLVDGVGIFARGADPDGSIFNVVELEVDID